MTTAKMFIAALMLPALILIALAVAVTAAVHRLRTGHVRYGVSVM